MLVREVMTRGAESIAPNESLQMAALRMREVGVGTLVVCEEGRPIGIITDRDIVVRGIAAGRDPVLAEVRSAMTPQVVFCSEDDDIPTAARLMEGHALRRIAVVDPEERLVGMLSVDDLALHSRVLAGEVIEHASMPERPADGGVWPWWE